jgi:hypothetical protein
MPDKQTQEELDASKNDLEDKVKVILPLQKDPEKEAKKDA